MNTYQRIVLNTVVSYLRSLLAAALSLLSSRWVLAALGAVDYGLFSLVAAVTMFLGLLNVVLSASVSRHLAYAIGRGDPLEVRGWFNAALSIHLVLAAGLAVIGIPLGSWVIGHELNVPADRVGASVQVFYASLVSLFIGVACVPYTAMFRAKQRIAALSVWDLLQSVLVFALACTLTTIPLEPLRVYGVGTALISLAVAVGQVAHASRVFPECSLSLSSWFDRRRIGEVFSFATWSLFGILGAMLRDQGSAILLNLFHGPTANAAYGIAKQVSVKSGELGASMVGALSPEVTAAEGRGDRSEMLRLAVRSSKLSTLLVMLFAMPLFLEMDNILKIWLRTPPAFTGSLCRLILAAFVIDRLTVGYMLAVNARGKIAAYQATLGTILIATLPLAWYMLRSGLGPNSVGLAGLITMTLCSVGRILWVRGLFHIPVTDWVTDVFLPCGLVGLLCLATVSVLVVLFPPTLGRLALSCMAGFFTWVVSMWFLGLTPGERRFVIENLSSLFRRLKGAVRPVTT